MSTLTVNGIEYVAAEVVIVVRAGVAEPALPGLTALWRSRQPDGSTVIGCSLPTRLAPGTPDPRD